jgi:hypothetical protein
MPYVLAFHDSELRDVTADAGTVRLRLSAASVSAADGERGWLTGVSLVMSSAVLRGETDHLFGRIAEGGLQHDSRLLRRMDLPGTLAAARAGEVVTLALRLANGAQLVAAGHRLQATLADNARFAPDLSC